MTIAQPSPEEIVAFGSQIQEIGLEYSETPISLRAGGQSHWYFDGRRAISNGHDLRTASEFIIVRADRENLDFNTVAGLGVGGRALASGVVMTAGDAGNQDLKWVHGNDDDSPGQRYGFGLHGTKVSTDCKVLVVDDTASTGDSLVTLIDMVRAEDGIVEDAIVLVDRSQGATEKRLGRIGVKFFALYEFIEEEGQIVPAA